MKNHEVIVALVWAVIGVLICIASISLRLGTWRYPGPGLFPFLTGGGIIIFSIYQIISQSFREPVKYKLWLNTSGLKKIGILIMCLAFYAILFRYIGFALCTFLFFLVVLTSLSNRDLIFNFIISFTITTCSYLIFRVFLMINLPKGFFGI